MNTLLNEEFEHSTDDIKETLVEYRTVWNRQQFLKHVGVLWNTITKKLLYNPRFQKDLKTLVHYPENSRDPWLFNAAPIKKYIEENFNEIFNKRG